VADELRRQYLIGYYSEGSADTKAERKLKVKVNRSKVTVKARRSYTYTR
jgi:hypothetical protein